MSCRVQCWTAVVWLVTVGINAGPAGAAGFARVESFHGWDHLFAGTRSEAMGQADLADARGPFSIFDNPAPLLSGQTAQVGYGKLNYVAGLALHQYGFAAEFGAYRLGFARMDLRAADTIVRTAYNPEGTGETASFEDRMQVVAAAVDVAALLAPDSAWQWTVGLAHRGYRYTDRLEAAHYEGVDLGSSVRYTRDLDVGRASFSMAGALRNVGQSDFVPRNARIGWALFLAVSGTPERDLAQITVAYAVKDIPEDVAFFDHRYLGLELSVYEAVSFRLGRDRQLFGGSRQYGFGLVVPETWLAPFVLTLDWTSMGLGDTLYAWNESRDMFSVTLGARY